MDLKSTYNKIAEDWFKDHHDDTWWHEGTEKFISLLPAGASILDVGCGAGVKARYLTKKGFNVTGIDFSEKMIEIAKRASPEINFQVMDVYEIDNYKKTFDAIFAQAVLLHIPKNRIGEVISKLKGRLKPGGFLYIAVKGIRADGTEEHVLKEDAYGYEYERFFSYFSLSELERLLSSSGMEIMGKLDKGMNETGGNWLQIIGKN